MTQDGDEIGAGWVPVPDPPDRPADWRTVVHRGDALTDIQRLGLWQGGSTDVPSGTSPASLFRPVGTGSLGGDGSSGPIYVVVHGWAPGYRPVVDAAGGQIVWWGRHAVADGRWASDWCWSPVKAPPTWTTPEVTVNPTGVVQQIHAFDPTATILAFSWIDDSATPSLGFHLPEAYASEAYTHLNGIRLANALDAAIDSDFFSNGGELRLIGHSHGSKVCTVAAKTLQDRRKQATHLTILDSPDSWTTRVGNAANMLGFHLEELHIRDPLTPGPGTYVDTYRSFFGVTYASTAATSPIRHVVDVSLHPDAVYTPRHLSYIADVHTYAAAWYGGAAAGAKEYERPAVGLAWPPVPEHHTPAMLQRWGGRPRDQWTLAPGPAPEVCRFATQPLTITETAKSPGVTADHGEIRFTPVQGQIWSTFAGWYPGQEHGEYGFAFDVEWSTAPAGALFVISVTHRTDGGPYAYTLLVLDPRSIPAGTRTSVAVSCDIWEDHRPVMHMNYLADPTDLTDVLTLTNPRAITVT